MSEKQESRVIRLLGIIYSGGMAATGWSWTRLNTALSNTLNAAIHAGIKFELDDFKEICRLYKPSYWFGDKGEEAYFRRAIEVQNTSVCLAIEHWLSRPPFTLDGTRIFVGRYWEWQGRGVICTSINADYVVACGYAKINKYASGWYGDGKPDKVFKITLEDLKAHRKAIRDAKKAENKPEQ